MAHITSNRLAVLGITGAFLLGYGYGLLSYKFDLFPVPVIRFVKEYAQDDGVDRIGYRDISQKTAVDCPQDATGMAVLLTLGQSNSANHGQTRYTPRNALINFNHFDGRCYRGADPLLGATGSGGSVWSRLGARLLESGEFDRVVVAPLGVNSSRIARWVPGGDLHHRIQDALEGLRAEGLEPTHVLWHQGEADAIAGMNGRDYASALQRLIDSLRGSGVAAPIFIAVASMCHNSGSDAIRAAQVAAADPVGGVFPGANSDRLEALSLRYDGCHFSAHGLSLHADMWYARLVESQSDTP